LHAVARIIGKLRAHYAPSSKHWWHITLGVSARGLTTPPFPIHGRTLELTLNLATHQLVIDSSDGWSTTLPLIGQSARGLCGGLEAATRSSGIDLDDDLLAEFADDQVLPYDPEAMARYLRAINWIDAVFKAFKGELREESSPVQIFPHHMDLAMSWFSGHRVPGVDPADEERADEQMTFGFVTGDESIQDAYFYATAYPVPAGWTDLMLPDEAYWHTEGWTGAILPYAALVASERPRELLLEYLRVTQAHGKRAMGG
jgi:hypothetical protein